MERVKFPVIILVLTGMLAGFLLGIFVGRSNGGQTLYMTQDPVPQAETAETYRPSDTTQGTAPAETESTEPVPTETEPLLVNLNEATMEELMRLPGVGEVLARRIIAYREEYGPFLEVDELLLVDGFGEKRIEEIRPYADVR